MLSLGEGPAGGRFRNSFAEGMGVGVGRVARAYEGLDGATGRVKVGVLDLSDASFGNSLRSFGQGTMPVSLEIRKDRQSLYRV